MLHAFVAPVLPLVNHMLLSPRSACGRVDHPSQAFASSSSFSGGSRLPWTVGTALSTRRRVVKGLCASANADVSHVVTIVSAGVLPVQLLYVVQNRVITEGAQVISWRDLSDRAVEGLVSGLSEASYQHLAAGFDELCESDVVDVAIQPFKIMQTPKRLAVFDLDSTLIQQETIDELATELGLQSEVADITRLAMEGKLDFADALRQRVALLDGLPVSALDAVKRRVVITPGAKELIHVLRKTGCATAVVSGGFDFLAHHVQDLLGLDHAYANSLEVTDDGCLTGRTIGPVVDAQFKMKTLLSLADKLDAPREAVLAVGDGSNDLPMLHVAGLGVAFNAKPIVQEQIKVRVNQPSLLNVLYILGFTEDKINSLLDR